MAILFFLVKYQKKNFFPNIMKNFSLPLKNKEKIMKFDVFQLNFLKF